MISPARDLLQLNEPHAGWDPAVEAHVGMVGVVTCVTEEEGV